MWMRRRGLYWCCERMARAAGSLHLEECDLGPDPNVSCLSCVLLRSWTLIEYENDKFRCVSTNLMYPPLARAFSRK